MKMGMQVPRWPFEIPETEFLNLWKIILDWILSESVNVNRAT